jgi:hypothetical protein
MNPRILGTRTAPPRSWNPGIVETPKRNVSYRLPADLIQRVNEDAVAEGSQKAAGIVYNPSAVVERILRAHYDAKPKGKRRTK